MAKYSKALAICVLLLLLIVCQEIVSAEGRHLKCRKCSKGHHKNSLRIINVGSKDGGAGTQMSKAENVDDFRPTVPGHSPGIGHSVHD
ncbi:UNVERIFIED_CONTAM: Precursor of CEP8 [Sesamum latifolium]|uniref:Precursor of CEP8 n=1 Tax=Sesamum latifolium TaxID=2727402 RepID=A0AAW2X9L0_9LAMI